MLQDVDNMEVSCIFDVEIGMFDQFKQSYVYIQVLVTNIGIVMLTAQHDTIFTMSFM